MSGNINGIKNAIKKQIALRVKTARNKKGLTQKELSKKMGTNQAFISRIESGSSMPEESTLVRFVEALELDDNYFSRCILDDFPDLIHGEEKKYGKY